VRGAARKGGPYRNPLRMWAFLTVGLPSKYRLDLIGVVAFRLSEIRPGWVSSEPRVGGALPTGKHSPVGTRRFLTASPYHPAGATHLREFA
jgi:hypothetical protein